MTLARSWRSWALALVGGIAGSGVVEAQTAKNRSMLWMVGVAEADLTGVRTGPILGSVVRFRPQRTLGVEVAGTVLLIPAGRSVCCGSDLIFVEPALTLQTSPSKVGAFVGIGGGIGVRLAGETKTGPTVVGLGGIQGPLSPRVRFRLEAKARALGSSASIVSVAAGFSVSKPAAPK